MKIDKIKAYIDLVREGGIAELEITEGDTTIRVLAGNGPIAVSRESAGPAMAGVAAPDAGDEASVGAGKEIVPAPMLGTFFRRPGPEEAPFIEPGGSVTNGQVLGIIEAMKTLNHVTAPRDGTIEAILVEDGDSVEYGSPLFRLS